MQVIEEATTQVEQPKPEVIMNVSIKGGHVLHFKINKSDVQTEPNQIVLRKRYSLSADEKDIGDITANDDHEAVTKGLVKISEIVTKISDAKKVLAEYLR